MAFSTDQHKWINWAKLLSRRCTAGEKYFNSFCQLLKNEAFEWHLKQSDFKNKFNIPHKQKHVYLLPSQNAW